MGGLPAVSVIGGLGITEPVGGLGTTKTGLPDTPILGNVFENEAGVDVLRGE